MHGAVNDERSAARRTRWEQPRTVAEATRLLSAGRWRIIAGGTDAMVAPARFAAGEGALDLSRVAGLSDVSANRDGVRIGALATWTEIAGAALPPAFDALRQAARQIGGAQIQNAGTLAGNLCNASPAADGPPCLLVLDAAVELTSLHGVRRVGLDRFITGPRATALRPDELLTAILFPPPDPGAASVFHKLGARAYQVISIVMAAALVEPDGDGRARRVAVAVGSCAPTARRLPALEARLAAVPLAALAAGVAVGGDDLAPLAPISDVRGTRAYRLDAAATLVRRAVAEAAARAR